MIEAPGPDLDLFSRTNPVTFNRLRIQPFLEIGDQPVSWHLFNLGIAYVPRLELDPTMSAISTQQGLTTRLGMLVESFGFIAFVACCHPLAGTAAVHQFQPVGPNVSSRTECRFAQPGLVL